MTEFNYSLSFTFMDNEKAKDFDARIVLEDSNDTWCFGNGVEISIFNENNYVEDSIRSLKSVVRTLQNDPLTHVTSLSITIRIHCSDKITKQFGLLLPASTAEVVLTKVLTDMLSIRTYLPELITFADKIKEYD